MYFVGLDTWHEWREREWLKGCSGVRSSGYLKTRWEGKVREYMGEGGLQWKECVEMANDETR